MKKITLALVAACLAVPALAQESKVPQSKDTPAVEMQRDHEAFQKAREEHRAQMKATEEKMEKLVKEYNKLKDGKKKEAKRAEIEKEVSAIHAKQLEFKKGQLAKFEERLANMKADFEKENSAEGQKEWVNEKTEALIKADGDVKALFGPGPDMRGPQAQGGPCPCMDKNKEGSCPCMDEKKDCPCKKGLMGQKGHRRGFMGKKGHKGPHFEGARPDQDN